MSRFRNLMFATVLMLNSFGFAQTDEFQDPMYAPGYDDFESINLPGESPATGGQVPRGENFRGGIPDAATRQPAQQPGGVDTKPGALSEKQKEKFAKAALEDITPQNFPETIDSFEFPNVDIQDVVKAVSELTGKNFIIDPGVRGKITIIAPSKVTVAEAYKAFLSSLAINGYAVVPSGAFLKIRTARNAQRDGIETYTGSYFPNSDQMVTKIIHLKHLSAETVNRDLRILQSKDGEMSVYAPTNSMIISDYGSNIERITNILKTLDVPGFEDQLEVVQVQYASAKDMAELIMKIVNKGDAPSAGRTPGSFSTGVPRFNLNNRAGGDGAARFTVIPDERTNSLLISGDKSGIDRVKRLLGQLDRRMDPTEAGGVHVYYVKYGDAEKLAQTLSGVAKEAAPRPAGGASGSLAATAAAAAGNQEVFGGDIKITADKNTNSLIIVSSKADYDTVYRLLQRIDIRRDQVYMEAIIMEMSGNDSSDYQIGFSQFRGPSGVKAGFNGIEPSNLQNLLSPVGGAGAILPFGDPNNTVTITPFGGGQTVVLPSLLGFINFLKTNQNANVLSNPQILAMDAQEASIVVGDKVIVGEQATAVGTSGTTLKTPQFEDANLELKIKPFISPEDLNIRMDLEASLKQLSNARTPAAFINSAQPLSTRKIKTTIMVHNGDTAVLGGLTKEEEQERITKVPLLGDIPILGWLFKSRSLEKAKTNLNIFLTPRIIRTGRDASLLLGEHLDERLEYIKKTAGGRDPFGERISQIEAVAQETYGDLPAEGEPPAPGSSEQPAAAQPAATTPTAPQPGGVKAE